MKRLLAMFLALAMILSCLPVMAFASGSDLPLTPQRTVKTEFAGVLSAVRAEEEYGTIDEVIAQIRQNLVARNSEFSVCGRIPYSTETTEDDLMDMTLELLYDAMEHTGVPNEGDYLYSHYDGGTYGYSYYNDDQWFYMTFRYTVAYTTTAEQEAEVDLIVESLLPQLRGLTDYETVCNIYDWFAENVRYDYDSGDDLRYSAYAVFLYRMAVCQGYASALYRLALELGVPCRMVSGTADNGQTTGGHAWNKVKLGSSWYLLDATWDAIYAQAGLDYNFFLKGSDNFDTDHFPDEAYTDVSATDFDPASLEPAEVASGTCGDNLTWVLTNDGTLTISGTGAMYDYIQDAPWTEYAPYIKKIIIGEGATTIGKDAFYYCNRLTDLTIPQGITSIGEYAFAYCESLPSVELPESLRSIGGRGFYSCSAMKSINFPAGLTTIGEYAFSYCKSLPTVTIPASVTAIGDSAFVDCNSLPAIHVEENNTAYCDVDGVLCDKALTTVIQCPRGYSGSFEIPNGVTAIGRGAFFFCNSLTGITIPDSVESIGDSAFANCTALAGVTLPANLKSIGHSAFDNCGSLTDMTIPAGVTALGPRCFYYCRGLTELTFLGDAPSIGMDAFYMDTITAYYPAENATWTADVMQQYNGTITWVAYTTGPAVVASGTCGDDLTWALTEDGTLTISGTGAMYERSSTNMMWFYLRDSITKVVVGDGATSIGASAFSSCSNLTTVVIADSVTSIGAYAFSGCTGLVSVSIPDSVTSIGDYAFSESTGLASVTLGNSLEQIGHLAFWNCTSLTSVVIPDSVTSIGNRAFDSCAGLTAVTLGNGVKSIGQYAFTACTSLTSVAIPDSVTSMGDRVFFNCTGLQSAVIGSGITSISGGMFAGCSGLTAVVIPDSVQSIGNYAFGGCTGLTSVSIGNGVTRIDATAFDSCTGLTSITFPASVTSLGDEMFVECTGLKEIYFLGDAPTTCSGVFYDVTATAYYPAGNETWTEEVMGKCGGNITWVAVSDGPAVVASGTCGDDLTWALTEDGVLTISGTGDMYNYSSSNQPWYSYRDSITEVVIEDGATIIGSNAFSCCTQLTEVTLPDTVISIFYYAFAGCVLLEEIILPESLGFINDCAFEGCTGLQQITLPAAVEHIGSCVFHNCPNLTQILVEEGNTCFSSVDGMLTDKTRTTLLFYPWGKGANCVIPEGITTLSKQPFYCCEVLTSVTVPASVTTIDDSSFHGCTNLTEITFLGDAPSFTNEFIFGGVTATAYYPASNPTWTEEVRKNYDGNLTWEAFMDAVAFGTCGESLNWVLNEDGVLTISGEGAMTDYQGVVWDPETNIESSDIPWNDYQDSITCVVVEEGVTTVGNNAFSHHANITAVELPESIHSIGAFAFSGTGITSITIPAGVTDIDSTAFGVLWSAAGDYGCDLCDQLTRIDVDPANTAYASDQYGVLYSKDMTTLVRCPSGFSGDYRIPDSVTLIAPDALNHCIKLTSITIPDGIANYVSVTGCNSLEELTLPAAKTSLGWYAIANCANLKRVTLSANTEHVEDNAFYKCPALAEIVFPGDAPVMGESAFQGVTATAYYPAGNDTWTEDVMQNYGGTITWVAYGEAEETPVAVIGDAEYASVAEALAAAESGDTVTLVADAHEENTTLALYDGVTLDLGAYDLYAKGVIGFTGSHLTGTEYRAATDYGRLFVSDANRLVLSGHVVNNDGSVGLLPVWDGDNGCYVMGGAFYNAGNYTLTTDESTISFMFAPSLRGDLRKGLFTDEGEMSDNGLAIVLRLTWHSGDGLAQQDFVYSSEFVSKFCKSGSGLFTFMLTGYEAMYIELEDLTITPMVVCDNGLTFCGQTVTGA